MAPILKQIVNPSFLPPKFPIPSKSNPQIEHASFQIEEKKIIPASSPP
jgi:hypothetical protein